MLHTVVNWAAWTPDRHDMIIAYSYIMCRPLVLCPYSFLIYQTQENDYTIHCLTFMLRTVVNWAARTPNRYDIIIT